MNPIGKEAHGALPKARIFISYSRKDMAFVDRLDAALKARDFEPLVDRTEIYAFEDWWQRIKALIGRADTVVFVLSPDAVASEVAMQEIIQAQSLNKRFAPIVYRRVEDAAIPKELRRLNFIFFDDLDRFDVDADKLAEALRTDIAWIRVHTEFGEAARRWAEAGRPSGLLLRSPALDEAERWLNSRPAGAPEPSGETRAFIATSRDDAARRELRRRVGGAVLGVIAIVAALAWRYQATLSDLFYWSTQVRGQVLTAAQEKALRPHDEFRECTQCPDMIVIPPGRFMMGSASGVGRDEERPQHSVAIVRQIAIAKYAVTFDKWDACAARGACVVVKDDKDWGRGSRPVINVSWYNARACADWLKRITGKTYRLLSEAEFEYAARAGTQTNFPWGSDPGTNNANCDGCGSKWDKKETAEVGSFAPNGFGLFDMSGNVGQWVEDCFRPDYDGVPTDGRPYDPPGTCSARVQRGGSAFDVPEWIRSASRHGHPPTRSIFADGFRVARDMP